MKKDIENYLVQFGEELGKEGYSIVKAGVNTFFKVKGELVSNTIDVYKDARFNIRLEDFIFEQEKLKDSERRNFYKNINYKQLNYLFELLDNARSSTYDLQAKILAKIYSSLILNQELNYFESTLLANIGILNEYDIYYFYKNLKLSHNIKDFNESVVFKIQDYNDLCSYRKCLQIGIIYEFDTTGMFGNSNRNVIQDKRCHISKYSLDFVSLIEEIILKD